MIKISDKDEINLKENKSPEPDEVPSQDTGHSSDSEWNFMKLTSIKGIGHERAADIGRIYNSEDELIIALNKGAVPLRNDIVDLLKDYYQTQMEA